jgi:hypothetical protein
LEGTDIARRHELTDVFKNHWHDWRDDLGRYFDRLTAGDLDKIDGNYGVLIQLLQERYGFSKERARAESDGFMAEIGKTDPNTRIDY